MDLHKSMVEAIRNDPVVGKGSCSSIDECWDDQDLIEAFKEPPCINTRKGAVLWARSMELRYLERGLDCRWGEDSDPQLVSYNKFKKLDTENPVED